MRGRFGGYGDTAISSRGILIDIGHRKIAEKATGMFSPIFNLSEDAIIAKTLDGIVTEWNPGAEAMLGYSAAEMVGAAISKLIPEGAAMTRWRFWSASAMANVSSITRPAASARMAGLSTSCFLCHPSGTIRDACSAPPRSHGTSLQKNWGRWWFVKVAFGHRFAPLT